MSRARDLADFASDSQINAGEIEDNAVTTAKIADSNVTNAKLANSTVTVSGDSGSDSVALGETLTISGTANEIETTGTSNTLTIGLPDDVNIAGDLTVDTNTLYVDSTNNRVGIGTASPTVALDVVGGASFTDNVDLGDNDRLRLGASQDLQIYHDGSNSLITDVGTGNLFVRADNLVLDDTSSTDYLYGVSGGAVTVYYAGSPKLATTSTGIDVTGTVVSDGLTVDTDTLYVDSTNNHIGVGTTSPAQIVHINEATTGSVRLRIENSEGFGEFSTDGDAVQLRTQAGIVFQSVNAGDTQIRDGNAVERMRIDTSGNVGIGTSSPSGKLNVKGERIVTDAGAVATNLSLGGRSIGITGVENLSTSGRAGFVNRITNDFSAVNDNAGFMHLYPFSDGDDCYAFRASVGTTLSDTFYVKQQGDAYFSGDVGIGTSSPSYPLHVFSSASPSVNIEVSGSLPNTALALNKQQGSGNLGNWTALTINGNDNTSYESRIQWFFDSISNGPIISSARTSSSAADLRFYTTASEVASERMRIQGNGYVGIGTSSPAHPFTVNSGTSNDDFCVGTTDTSFPHLSSRLVYDRTTASGANVRVDSSTSHYVLRRSTSSIRYKTEVNDAVHGLNDVINLRSVTYKGINDGDEIFGGLIAEEVHEAGLTEFVEYDEEGNPDALHYGNMVSLAFKAIQELKADNDALRARIEALENA